MIHRVNSQQRLNIAASAPPSRHCHYLAPPLPLLVISSPHGSLVQQPWVVTRQPWRRIAPTPPPSPEEDPAAAADATLPPLAWQDVDLRHGCGDDASVNANAIDDDDYNDNSGDGDNGDDGHNLALALAQPHPHPRAGEGNRDAYPPSCGYKSYSCIKHVYLRTRTSMTCLIRYWQMSYQLHSWKDTSNYLWRRLLKHFKSN